MFINHVYSPEHISAILKKFQNTWALIKLVGTMVEEGGMKEAIGRKEREGQERERKAKEEIREAQRREREEKEAREEKERRAREREEGEVLAEDEREEGREEMEEGEEGEAPVVVPSFNRSSLRSWKEIKEQGRTKVF
jgi:hypothetical protein